MAIRLHSLKFIHENIDRLDNSNKVKILDMGNSYIRPDTYDWIEKNIFKQSVLTQKVNGKYFSFNVKAGGSMISKEYFTFMEYDYTSIDLNGREGALQIDLKKPVPEYLNNNFDIIIDMGTSEHVDNQYFNFKNLYDMCKVGGIFIHTLPLENNWEGHCKYKYNLDFFKLMAKTNGYEILTLDIRYRSRQQKDVCCCIKKTNSDGFMNELEFWKLPIVIEDGEDFRDRIIYPWAYDEK